MKYKQFTENKISAEILIPNDVKEIAKAYHFNGKDLFVVGGAIRDFLQGKTPHDYDLVTDATPEESKQILKGWNVSDEQGKNFGVIRVYTDSEPLGHEIAVYRADISKGRDVKGDDEKVVFGPNIGMKKDSERRDLTINSLYYDIIKKEIVDLVGGVDDIKNNIIRTVGKPGDRFAEDRLRILRCLRFAARTGGEIDPTTSQAIKDDNRLRGISPKEDVSQERIHEEWDKVMEHAESGGNEIMERYIGLLTEYDMWEQMFPGMIMNENIIIEKLNSAIIFHDLFAEFNNITKKRKYLIQKLKFPSNLIDQIEFLQLYLNVAFDIFDNGNTKNRLDNIGVFNLAEKKKAYHIDNNLIKEFDELFLTTPNFCNAFLKYCSDGFIISGLDLIKQGFKGKEIGDEKERLEIERFKNEYMQMK
jgi:tRNA nucleotidyltransferase/poly(A) polymerase